MTEAEWWKDYARPYLEGNQPRSLRSDNDRLLKRVQRLDAELREARNIIALLGGTDKAPCVRRIDAVLGETVALQECEDTRAVLAAIGHDTTPLTNDELAERMGCSKAESSKRVTNAVSTGRVERTRDGRTVAIAPVRLNGRSGESR